MIKIIPKKNKEGKVAVQGGFTNNLWKDEKCKGEGERQTQLTAEFQTIARRDQKAFLNEQCKKIEEKNRMGKTRDLFKEIGEIKRTFHARMGTRKDRKGKHLTGRRD